LKSNGVGRRQDTWLNETEAAVDQVRGRLQPTSHTLTPRGEGIGCGLHRDKRTPWKSYVRGTTRGHQHSSKYAERTNVKRHPQHHQQRQGRDRSSRLVDSPLPAISISGEKSLCVGMSSYFMARRHVLRHQHRGHQADARFNDERISSQKTKV